MKQKPVNNPFIYLYTKIKTKIQYNCIEKIFFQKEFI